jgi:hypothetical protein
MGHRAGRGRRSAQDALLDVNDGRPAPEPTPLPAVAPRRHVGRLERAVQESVRAVREPNENGRREGDPRWAGAERLAYTVAGALDQAARKGDPYAVAQLAPRLLDVLRDLMLTPGAIGAAAGDDLGSLLADLATPAVGDTA